jgi:hypothetical protein
MTLGERKDQRRHAAWKVNLIPVSGCVDIQPKRNYSTWNPAIFSNTRPATRSVTL